MAVDPRTPVLVGAGTADDDAPVLDLMESALRAAARDAGAPSLLGALQSIAVTKGTWAHTDPGREVVRRVGAGDGVRSVLVEPGVPQQTPVSDALRRIRAGSLDVAAVVGGEARAHERRAGPPPPEGLAGGTPDEVWRPDGEIVAPPELAVRLVEAVQQYAVLENALRAAEGRTIDEHLADIDGLWAGFNAVARANPHAAFASPPRDAAALRSTAHGNRPLAWPYNKWHSTQWTVDQSAALLLCSAEAASAHGVPRDRWLFPLVALESSFSLAVSRRRALHRWPAMRALGERAAAHIGRPLHEVEHTDLYSCFPVAVRVQQRELGLPLDGVPTITGGMAFAGGPFNSYTYQSTAAMAALLRGDPGAVGLVSTVSGFLTKPGLAAWSAVPPDRPALIADLADDARAATEVAPVHDADPGGAVRVAGYTVLFDDAGAPARLVVVGDAVDDPDGRRIVRIVDDPALAAESTRTDQVEQVLLSQ